LISAYGTTKGYYGVETTSWLGTTRANTVLMKINGDDKKYP